jgi:cytochrome c-type biogenesis protein CcmF
MIPIGLFLIFLTAVGPLLAWRRTSAASVIKNFALPAAFAVVATIIFAAFARPWHDVGELYSLIGFYFSILVIATIVSEFYRGGRVLQGKLNTNLFGAMYWLTRRNTRRYGGYLVHFGVVLMAIGLAGKAFNMDKEQEMGLGDKLQVGNYELVGQKYTNDDLPNYEAQAAVLDVYKNGRFLTTIYPELRVYKSSKQSDHKVAIRSTALEDLYVVYEGQNPDTDRPIIKAFVNPLVSWLWIGWLVVVFGTGVALVPNAAQIKSVVPVAHPVAAMETVGAAK